MLVIIIIIIDFVGQERIVVWTGTRLKRHSFNSTAKKLFDRPDCNEEEEGK